MSRFTHHERSDIYTAERSDIYTAERSNIYTAERSDIYTAERSDIYTAERSDIYTNPEDDGTLTTTESNRHQFDNSKSKKASAEPYRLHAKIDHNREDLFDVESEPSARSPDLNTTRTSDRGTHDPDDDWNLATQQKRAAAAPTITEATPIFTVSNGPQNLASHQFIPAVCVVDTPSGPPVPPAGHSNEDHHRPTVKPELEDVPMLDYMQAKCQSCFGCAITLACVAIVAIVVLVAVVVTQTSGSTPAPALLTTAPSFQRETAPPVASSSGVVTSVPATAPIVPPETTSPTSAPTRDRAVAVTEYINSVKLSYGTLVAPEPQDERRGLQSGETPEEQALWYLIYRDPLELSPDSGVAAQFRLRQRYALLTLLVQMNGFYTRVTANHECDWELVECSILFDPPVVVAITEGEDDVPGYVHPDLGLLTSLTTFQLGFSGMIGSLPDTIGLWTDLEEFDVGLNTMTGTLPNSIGSWTKLTRFEISDNFFNGTLPASINSWTDLEAFEVEENAFSGTIPRFFYNVSSVQSASFAFNLFTGSMPFCDRGPLESKLEYLWADCYEVVCPCCTLCENTTDTGKEE